MSADEEAVEDFVELTRLNRHMGIVIDSDKKRADDEINATKKRVKHEFEQSSYFVWVTRGKEIENYVGPGLIREALVELYGENVEVIRYREYGDCIKYQRNGGTYRVPDKVRLASLIAKREGDTRLDLDDRIAELVQYIRESNGLEKAQED